ncbi:MAG: YvcK family protein [Anaerolinea sp.]|nr:YvcK family protein [Anaerolinea sp.]
MNLANALSKWFTPGIGVKRWLLLLLLGVMVIAVSLSFAILQLAQTEVIARIAPTVDWFEIVIGSAAGFVLVAVAIVKLSRNILAPYRKVVQGKVIDAVYRHSMSQRGVKVVAIGGGTGLPSVLKGMKMHTSNITAIVTVADDGGSSGRLRRDLGVLPPGDLRNNIAALADDESLMTRLFQYRFNNGDLGGHAFGNLFISALAGVTGSLETALIETERVLNIQGSVLPATLEDVTLIASVKLPGKPRAITIRGESTISAAGGYIEQISVEPAHAEAYPGSVEAILNADLVLLGPGSLYTSILPNMLVKGIAEALRATSAYKVYICNIATQPGETDGYTVADHVLALERHIGRGVFQAVLANNSYPTENAGANTRYVKLAPPHHEILQRYEVLYIDLVDSDRPWRHDPQKLVRAILWLSEAERSRGTPSKLSIAPVQ